MQRSFTISYFLEFCKLMFLGGVSFINKKCTTSTFSWSVNAGALDNIINGIHSFCMCEKEDVASLLSKKNIRPTTLDSVWLRHCVSEQFLIQHSHIMFNSWMASHLLCLPWSEACRLPVWQRESIHKWEAESKLKCDSFGIHLSNLGLPPL